MVEILRGVARIFRANNFPKDADVLDALATSMEGRVPGQFGSPKRRGAGRKVMQIDPATATSMGSKIRAYREARGLTVTELADKAGFGPASRGYISKVEHGRIRRIGKRRKEAFARALDVNPEDLD